MIDLAHPSPSFRSRRPRLAWEIASALLGLLLGAALTLAAAPAHARQPQAEARPA